MRTKRAAIGIIVAAACGLGTLVAAGSPAFAYGGDGHMNVYQIGISFNCDNVSFCGTDNVGGEWGWGELDNTTTNQNTGDAEIAGCFHGVGGGGAVHISVDVTDWWIGANGDFITNEVDTISFRGETQIETLTNDDIGVPATPGHYSTNEIFGFTPPPGVSAQIQVAFKPAH